MYARILKERYGIHVTQVLIVTFSPEYKIHEYAEATNGGPVRHSGAR